VVVGVVVLVRYRRMARDAETSMRTAARRSAAAAVARVRSRQEQERVRAAQQPSMSERAAVPAPAAVVEAAPLVSFKIVDDTTQAEREQARNANRIKELEQMLADQQESASRAELQSIENRRQMEWAVAAAEAAEAALPKQCEPAPLPDQQCPDETPLCTEQPEPPTPPSPARFQEEGKSLQIEGVPDTRRSASYRVVTYNLRCDKDPEPHRWCDRAEHVLHAVQNIAPDILGLQESKNAYVKALAARLGMMDTGVPRRKDDESTSVLFNPQRFTALDSTTYVLSDRPGIAACPPSTACCTRSEFCGRICQHVRIFTHTTLLDLQEHEGDQGHVVHVINTHYPLETDEQHACTDLLAKYVQTSDAIGTNDTLVVMGDFNSHYAPTETGSPVERLRTMLGLEDTHNLTDEASYADGFELTEQGGFPGPVTHRLDHLLYAGSARCVSAGMTHPTYTSDDGNSTWRPSDHEPLWADLTIG